MRMLTNNELRAALEMILARLESTPRSVVEWEAINAALRDSARYAAKTLKMWRMKAKCEAKTPICSGKMVRRYSVNGSEKEGQTFALCGPCKVYLGRTAKITEPKASAKPRRRL